MDSPILIAVVGIAAIVAVAVWFWRVRGMAFSTDVATAIAALLQSLFNGH